MPPSARHAERGAPRGDDACAALVATVDLADGPRRSGIRALPHEPVPS